MKKRMIISACLSAVLMAGSMVSMPYTAYAATNDIVAELGDTYTINEGYIKSKLRLLVPTLKSQTPADATSSDILYGKSAWVNGKLVNGEMTTPELSPFVMAHFSEDKAPITDGYYTNVESAVNAAYELGVAAGKVDNSNMKVEYTIKHTHGDFCYPKASYTTGYYRTKVEYERADGSTAYDPDGFCYYADCSVCGKRFTDKIKSGGPSHSDSQQRAINRYYAHLKGRVYCTAKGYQCEKEEGEQTVDKVDMITEGDEVISATIKFEKDEP